MTAAAWNERYPVRTVVDYFPVRGREDFTRTRTRSEAWDTHDKMVLVMVDGRSGGVSVAHVWPVLEAVR